MTTVAQNRWAELITIESAVSTVGSTTQTLGGWRSCRDSTCVTDADGRNKDGETELALVASEYISSTYSSSLLDRTLLPIGSLVGFWAGVGDDPIIDSHEYQPAELPRVRHHGQFVVGSEFADDVPASATQLVLGFHDEAQWNNNHGQMTVTVAFEGYAPLYYVVYATQCIYFSWADEGLFGPAPYYEDIDGGTADGPHRPTAITVPDGAPTVSILAEGERVRDEKVGNDYPYLKLQRYLYDRVVSSLTASEMLWRHGYNTADFYLFILQGGALVNISKTCDILNTYINGPTVVAIKKTVHATQKHIMNAINRGGILPQRIL